MHVSRRRNGRVWLSATLVVLATGITACSSDGRDDGGSNDGGDRSASSVVPLGTARAQQLALMRLSNHRRGASAFTATSTVDGRDVRVEGVVDWIQHVGSAVITPQPADGSAAAEPEYVQWGFTSIARRPAPTGASVPSSVEDEGWTVRPIDPTVSTMDTMLLLLLNLANPQAENPQLLAQSDAAYAGEEEIDGILTQVFIGPSGTGATTSATVDRDEPARTTYWIDATSQLVRFDARLGTDAVATIHFDLAPAPAVAYLPELVTG